MYDPYECGAYSTKRHTVLGVLARAFVASSFASWMDLHTYEDSPLTNSQIPGTKEDN